MIFNVESLYKLHRTYIFNHLSINKQQITVKLCFITRINKYMDEAEHDNVGFQLKKNTILGLN